MNSSKMATHRAQVWSADFLSAVSIFLLIFLLFIFIWNNLTFRWNSYNSYVHMQTDALFAADALITTPGEPPSWELFSQINDSNISAIGLSNSRNSLSTIKLERLVIQNSSSYSFVKERLGLQRYEFGFRIMNLGRNFTYYEFGIFNPGLHPSVVIDRTALLNQTPVVLRLEVWR